MVAYPHRLGPEADIAPVAALMADATRAAMLTALLDDRPLAAGELARLAGVSPATASARLARLMQGGLITGTSEGRHRYYRLNGRDVAAALEALGHISPPIPVRSLRASRQEAALAGGAHLLRPPGRPGGRGPARRTAGKPPRDSEGSAPGGA